MIFIYFVKNSPVPVVIPDVFDEVGEFSLGHVFISELGHGFHFSFGCIEGSFGNRFKRKKVRQFEDISDSRVNLS